MITLRALQENLQAHLLTQELDVISFITKPTQGEIHERLAVYSEAYRLRLMDALQKDYAVLKKLLGEKVFVKLTEKYIDAYPSRYFSINYFGQYLAAFLRQTIPYNKKPYLSELAGFIWSLSDTITTPSASVLTTQDLAALSPNAWPELYLHLQPSVKQLLFTWNVFNVWQALIRDEPLPNWVKLAQPACCVVWRKEQEAYACLLTEIEQKVLDLFKVHRSFAEICEELTQYLPEEEIAQFVVNLLMQWVKNEMFVAQK